MGSIHMRIDVKDLHTAYYLLRVTSYIRVSCRPLRPAQLSIRGLLSPAGEMQIIVRPRARYYVFPR